MRSKTRCTCRIQVPPQRGPLLDPPPLRITAQSQVTSGRAAPAPARIQFAGAQFPPHMPPGRACGGKPASPVPLRSTAARPAAPANPLECSAPRRPLPPCSGRLGSQPHRAPGKPPTTCSDVERGALRETLQVIGHLWLAPQESDLLERASGTSFELAESFSSRSRLRGRRFKWNLFDARPLFHLSRRPTRRRRAPIGFACAKSVGQRIGKRAASRSFGLIRARVVGRSRLGKPGSDRCEDRAWRWRFG